MLPLPQARGAPARREIAAALRPWQAQLRRQSMLSGALRGALAGSAAAVLIALAARVTPLPDEHAIAAILGTLALAAGALFGLVRAPSAYRTARRVDRQLRLADRLSTAWEATGEGWALARLQASDALAHLANAVPARDLPLRLARREVGIVAAALAATILLWTLPNPMDEVLRQREEERAQIAAATQQVEEAARLAAEAAALTPEERAAIQLALEQLQRELAQAGGPREALAAISTAEDELRRLADPAAKEKAEAQSTMARAVSGDERTAALGEAIGRGDREATSQEAVELAGSLSSIDDEQRREVAQTLQATANEVAAATRGQSALTGGLRQAGRAVASGDSAAAEAALGELAEEIGALQDGLAGQAQLAQTSRSLRSAREAVARTTAGQAAAAGRPTSASGTTAGSQQGQGAGQGSGQGQGAGTGQGAGSSGSAGAGGGSGGSEGGTSPGGAPLGAEAARLPGGDEQVFIPGQEGTGQSIEEGVDSQPAPGTFRPYAEVVGRYSQAARDHVERSAIPPALKETVRQYFSGLEGR